MTRGRGVLSRWAALLDSSKNLLVRRLGDEALRAAMPVYLRGTVLDIGCGEKPLALQLRRLGARHIGLDHPDSQHDASGVDVFAAAYHIPFRTGSVDSILCTAVLEHLEEPGEALAEAYRVLKPGGAAVYTVPFIWHLHEEPRDFYRFSRYGLRHLFEKTGFALCELRPLSGFWATFLQLLTYKLFAWNRGPLRYLPAVPAAGLILQVAGYLLDRLDRDERWTWMYLVAARKPDE